VKAAIYARVSRERCFRYRRRDVPERMFKQILEQVSMKAH
jgi:hypothetical protein